MSIEVEKSFKSSKIKNSSKRLYLNRSAFPSSNNKYQNQNSERPKSHIINNKKKIEYGTTALKIARQSLERLRDKNEADLFLMLQHKIKTEFIKFKTFENYTKKEKHFLNLQGKRYNKIQNKKLEREMLENDRLEMHFMLNEKEKFLRKEKIKNYEYIYNKKERKINANNLSKYEYMKDKIEDEEIKNQEVRNRLNSLNYQDEKRRHLIEKTMKEKDKKRELKLAQKASEKKASMEQEYMEKRQEIDSFLDLKKKNEEMIYGNYKMKEKKDMEKIEELNARKENEKKERELKNIKRFENHEYNLGLIQNSDTQRNHDYYNKLKIIEENKKRIQEEKDKKSEEKRKNNEEKKIMIQFNLINCEKMNNNFRERVKNRILEKEKITNEIMRRKRLEHIKKYQCDNDQMEYVKKKIELDDSFKRNKKREEMKDKNQKINDFLNEKQMINENKKHINDNYSDEYKYYSQKINELMYKRPMDKISLNIIQDMFRDNHKLSGMIKNIDK